MTDKAYIVANKEQELDILKKFERQGIYWNAGEYPTDFIPSEKYDLKYVKFPYALVKNESIYWSSIDKLKDAEIVYDGRKEVKMYKVTQEFVNELIKWSDERSLDATSGSVFTTVAAQDLDNLPNVVQLWRLRTNDPIERNNRLIAIIQWLNGEEVFEVEEPHKFVVRNDKPDRYGDYYYVKIFDGATNTSFSSHSAAKFSTREEAQEWANSHQVVIEVDAEGNEVK